MKTVALITCSGQKLLRPAAAQNLYCSERFLLSKSLVKTFADEWFIVSAQYGLVSPKTTLRPYDRSLAVLESAERKEWAAKLIGSLTGYLSPGDVLATIGDSDYFSDLCSSFTNQKIFAPFLHIDVRHRIPWLQLAQPSSSRRKEVEAFYSILSRLERGLGGAREFAKCSGAVDWPKRGIYFFLHPEELRLFNPKQHRVVRIGTHAVSTGSKSTLWQRLKTHRGNEDGSGSHRGSIFRSHVGSALLARSGRTLSTWGTADTANTEIRDGEADLELEVSSYLKSLNLLWLYVPDEASKFSDRAYLEQNIIALLSGQVAPIDIPEESWLGFNCPNPAVQRSGLWNVNYTNFQYDPEFLKIMDFYVDVTIGKKSPPAVPLAPKNWYEAGQSGYKQAFLRMD